MFEVNSFIILIIYTNFASLYQKSGMRTLEELVNTDDPGWPIINEWISMAKNKVDVLPCDLQRAQSSLVNMQVTTRSLMGAVVYNTGGLLVDNGWIRILGSGCNLMKRTLPDWNQGKTFDGFGDAAPYLLMADDVVGGFYAINGGFFGNDTGNIYYFSPDTLDWLPMEIGYSQFLLFCFETDLDDFYEGLRWQGWRDDVAELSPDQAYTFYPSLWTKEGQDIDKVSKAIVSIDEVYKVNMEMKNTLG